MASDVEAVEQRVEVVDRQPTDDRGRKRLGTKKGSLSQDEMDFVMKSFEEMDDVAIAKALNRNPTIIRRLRKFYNFQKKVNLVNADQHINELHKKHYWDKIQKNLMANEIKYFELEWAALAEQLSTHEVLHTDEMMVTDLIMAQIMLDRNLERKKSILQQIKYVEKMIEDEMNKEASVRDPVELSRYRNDFSSMQASIGAINKEYMEVQQRKDILFKNLKSTRDQRINQIEESRKDLFARIKLLDEKANREKEGYHAELLRLAADKERDRLEDYHTYEDGTIDAPVLTPEGVLREEK
jgi:hypothetical protein